MIQQWFLLLALAALVAADEEIGLCCLCDGCNGPASGRGDLAVSTNGLTCNQLVLTMADPTEHQQGSSSCKTLKSEYYNHCCNEGYSPVSYQAATIGSPGDKFSQGSNPVCTLCHNGKYPEEEYTITAVLGFSGNPTCADLYWMGLKGQITDQMCAPLQDYMDRPCGCWNTTPNPNKATSSTSYYGTDKSAYAPDTATTTYSAPDATDTSTTFSDSEMPVKVPFPTDTTDSKTTIYGEAARGNLNRRRLLKGSSQR
jgi:hypothetical protein